MLKKTTLVSLTGGLGNQLFQLAEGLSNNPEHIYLVTFLGKPRCTQGEPDLLQFSLPENCLILDKREAPIFVQKVAGFVLRKGIKRRNLEKFALWNRVLSLVANLILVLYIRRLFLLRIGNGVGYSEVKRSRKDLVIGYFQHRHNLELPHVNKLMRGMYPIVVSEKLDTLIQAALLERPIFVHYRLTDYLSEDNFGTPSLAYYASALEELDAANRNIWIFSDDIAKAQERFPEKFKAQAKFVDDLGLNSAQTMHLFRFGFDYVIANSSFSWWGAALRQNLDSRVIVPNPWFKGLDDPLNLIPMEWEKRESL